MCRIAGLFSKEPVEMGCIERMIMTVKHGGPDSQNYIALNGARDWLGHARLSIIDLSDSGNQPMTYLDDRYYLVFNGEIYNYIELKKELSSKNYQFKTDTDTEVILAAYAYWGEKCLDHFNGMYAFVLVDNARKEYFAARDRYGVKPLYYWYPADKGLLAFASEIKEFMELPGWSPKVNGPRALDYLSLGLTDHTSETLFAGVFQVRGGEYVKGSLEDPIGSFSLVKWYEPPTDTIKISETDAVEGFKELFYDAVRLRLRSDVAVGSCLSGGLDSSSIVCVMNDILGETDSRSSQRTVSARAKGTSHDESAFIDVVMKERGIEGYFVDPAPEDLWNIKNRLIWHQDEPFGSTSVYAQWCVFQKAKQSGLTVMLDGQGADELLAGYLRFFAPYYSQLFTHFRWKKLAEEVRCAGEYHGYTWKTAAKGILKTNLPSGVLNLLLDLQSDRAGITWYSENKLGGPAVLPAYYGNDRAKSLGELSSHLLFYNHLPMLLRYEDRNSMAHAIESRLPFLDYRLVEFVQSMPDDYKISDGQTKSVLRKAMKGVLPDQINKRMDKIGFETPEEKWEKEHPLEFRAMIENAIEKTDGILNRSALDYFDKVIAGKRMDFTVWRIINFGTWYDMFINGNEKALLKN